MYCCSSFSYWIWCTIGAAARTARTAGFDQLHISMQSPSQMNATESFNNFPINNNNNNNNNNNDDANNNSNHQMNANIDIMSSNDAIGNNYADTDMNANNGNSMQYTNSNNNYNHQNTMNGNKPIQMIRPPKVQAINEHHYRTIYWPKLQDAILRTLKLESVNVSQEEWLR